MSISRLATATAAAALVTYLAGASYADEPAILDHRTFVGNGLDTGFREVRDILAKTPGIIVVRTLSGEDIVLQAPLLAGPGVQVTQPLPDAAGNLIDGNPLGGPGVDNHFDAAP